MECYCYLRNVQDVLSAGKTPHERRFGEPFNGPVVPFGAMVEHHPISAKDLSRFHQFGPKVLPGIFLGYVLHAVRIWEGGILIADMEEMMRKLKMISGLLQENLFSVTTWNPESNCTCRKKNRVLFH